MSSSDVVVEPQWVTLIRVHSAYMHAAVHVNDFTYFDAVAKLHEKAPQLMKNDFHKLLAPPAQRKAFQAVGDVSQLSPDQSQTLETIAKQGTNNLQAKSEEIKARIEADGKKIDPKSPDVDAWEKEMRQKNDDDKAALIAQMDAMTEDAIKSIHGMDPAARAPAAAVWVGAQNIVSQVLGKVINTLQVAVNAVVGFVNNAIDAVENAFNDAKNFIGDRINDIGNFFGSIF